MSNKKESQINRTVISYKIVFFLSLKKSNKSMLVNNKKKLKGKLRGEKKK